MSCTACGGGGGACLCAIVGADSIVVTGSGNADNQYVISFDQPCESVQDCVGSMLTTQGFTYDDADAKFVNAGAAGTFLTANGTGGASFQAPPAGPSCEFDQDCVGAMLNSQGFVYNDASARFDNAGANGSVLTSDGSGGASFVAAATVDNNVADGRLTLTSGTPVTTSDVLAAGTIYYTPYKGNKIALYSGSAWVKFAFTERSLALTLTSGKPYDVFLYNNAGTLTLEVLVWTNDTTRATALVRQDGVWVKSGATTRRYLGTIYASASNQCEDSAAKRYVWNSTNRVARTMSVVEATATWNYALTTYRQTNGSSTNTIQFVVGLSEDTVTAKASSAFSAATDAGGSSQIGINLDTINAATATLATQFCGPDVGGCTAKWSGYPGIGKHAFLSGESNRTATTYTYYGSSAHTSLQGQIYA